jgi:hypothetical protein
MISPALDRDKEQFDIAVAEIERHFPNDVERIRYTADEDWAHDPALFFRVLLKDRPGEVLDVSADPRSQAVFSLCDRIMSRIRAAVSDAHLQPYFRFRWASEQARRRDPEWE